MKTENRKNDTRVGNYDWLILKAETVGTDTTVTALLQEITISIPSCLEIQDVYESRNVFLPFS